MYCRLGSDKESLSGVCLVGTSKRVVVVYFVCVRDVGYVQTRGDVTSSLKKQHTPLQLEQQKYIYLEIISSGIVSNRALQQRLFSHLRPKQMAMCVCVCGGVTCLHNDTVRHMRKSFQ